MSATLDELERLLGLVVTEQRNLHGLLVRHRAAMAALRTVEIDEIARSQEQVRVRLAAIESRRRLLTAQAARELALPASPEPTLTQLAERMTDRARRQRFTALRDELRAVAQEVAAASHVAGRVAGAVLGHLNTAMRLLQGAMRDSGTYTRSGAPRMGGRLGAVNAVG